MTNSLFPSDIARISTLIESVIIGLFALIGGLLSDLVGRKRVVISGFVFLGVGYAVIGILPEILISWYFYAVADGVAWGIFGAIFLMILWGDLANNMKPEKYYAIGSIPYLLSVFLQLIIADYIINIILVYTVFSLASFFLFLAVIPLMYAPETLPEKKIKERELKKYVEKAKKVRKKYD
ncbi:MFS transporter [Candidatus Bathyarchaeota archaeon]|nr:MFS transporter [Candidatus Bathyarchaeota archaeon]